VHGLVEGRFRSGAVTELLADLFWSEILLEHLNNGGHSHGNDGSALRRVSEEIAQLIEVLNDLFYGGIAFYPTFNGGNDSFTDGALEIHGILCLGSEDRLVNLDGLLVELELQRCGVAEAELLAHLSGRFVLLDPFNNLWNSLYYYGITLSLKAWNKGAEGFQIGFNLRDRSVALHPIFDGFDDSFAEEAVLISGFGLWLGSDLLLGSTDSNLTADNGGRLVVVNVLNYFIYSVHNHLVAHGSPQRNQIAKSFEVFDDLSVCLVVFYPVFDGTNEGLANITIGLG